MIDGYVFSSVWSPILIMTDLAGLTRDEVASQSISNIRSLVLDEDQRDVLVYQHEVEYPDYIDPICLQSITLYFIDHVSTDYGLNILFEVIENENNCISTLRGLMENYMFKFKLEQPESTKENDNKKCIFNDEEIEIINYGLNILFEVIENENNYISSISSSSSGSSSSSISNSNSSVSKINTYHVNSVKFKCEHCLYSYKSICRSKKLLRTLDCNTTERDDEYLDKVFELELCFDGDICSRNINRQMEINKHQIGNQQH
ncbi:hypothetical protein PPL_00082 [Heterostelium album PN500]|uniref:Uncharacterized protein n=1 Tax=Heterostelium pallidum (strain ATCC 26659 / Pp 5 / PN500) TaxID=670386 RepID=D3AVH1_HETP5|nr:hypothetical protein PPL_00082 [Heterostelium album PN500]EFA86294.1 hypothetical protein PPL_00082 [Heterostelium album PN500]|eukprot:XP_020438399.1 hypothetical protein PPL_00082 [Heterostelium album PN500]